MLRNRHFNNYCWHWELGIDTAGICSLCKWQCLCLNYFVIWKHYQPSSTENTYVPLGLRTSPQLPIYNSCCKAVQYIYVTTSLRQTRITRTENQCTKSPQVKQERMRLKKILVYSTTGDQPGIPPAAAVVPYFVNQHYVIVRIYVREIADR